METKFKVRVADFLQCLQMGSSCSIANGTLPIYEKTLIEFNFVSGEVITRSYNGSTGITCKSNCIEDSSLFDTSDLKILVDSKPFLSAFREINSDAIVNISCNENNIVIKHSHGYFDFPTYDSKEFVSSDAWDLNDDVYYLPRIEFMEMIQEASKFTSNDTLILQMCGVFLFAGDGEFGVCGTNSRALYCNSLQIDSLVGMERKTCIIPNISIPTIIKCLGCPNDETIEVRFRGNNIIVVSGNVIVVSYLTEGRFPPYEKIIPQQHLHKFSANIKDVQSSLRRALVCGNQGTRMVVLGFDGMSNRCDVRCEDLDFSRKTEDSFIIQGSTSNITLGCNGDKLKDCISVFSDENVIFLLTQANSAILIKQENNPNKNVLVMPLRID